jgi:hypothetical protein
MQAGVMWGESLCPCQQVVTCYSQAGNKRQVTLLQNGALLARQVRCKAQKHFTGIIRPTNDTHILTCY